MIPQVQGQNVVALNIFISNDLSEALRIILAVLFAMGFLITIFYFIFSRTTLAKDPRKGIIRTISGLQIWLVVLMILLVSGLIRMRGEPLFPNMVGIVVNICWQAGTIFALRTQKKKLLNLDSATSLITSAKTS